MLATQIRIVGAEEVSSSPKVQAVADTYPTPKLRVVQVRKVDSVP